MYKNLDGESFGVTGRQNEVIELAKSYGFEGINVDLNEMHIRTKASGQEFATRYIDSAKVKVGGFKLPVKVTATEEIFKADLDKLRECCEIAKAVDATICTYQIEPATDGLAYQENFELHSERLGQVADVLKEHGIKLGIAFNAVSKRREGKDSEFIYQAEPALALIKSIGRPNVGLALDLWHWIVGGGTLDQISELSTDEIVAVRFADLPDEYDPATISSDQRLMPGSTEGNQCLELIKILHNKNYEGPITPGHSAAIMNRVPRDTMVQRCRNAVDAILVEAGVIEPPALPVAPPAVEEAEESAEIDATAEGEEVTEADAAETAEA